MIYLKWASDVEKDKTQITEHKTLNSEGVYHFVCDPDPIKVDFHGYIDIDIYLTPGLYWKTISLRISELQDGAMNDESGREVGVSIQFSIKKKFMIGDGYQLFISINLISLHLYRQDASLAILNEREGHRIVMQIKIKSRKEMMQIRTIYLGRAQKIRTHQNHTNRIYSWVSGDQPFGGIGMRSVEDLNDIKAIQMYPMISPRPNVVTIVSDHDSFSNEDRCLPINFEEGEAVNLQFFNLKFNPPKFVEIQVRWAEFLGSKEGNCHIIHDKDISLTLTFEIVDERKIYLKEITFKVLRYLSSLDSMGDNKPAKTV